MEQVGEESSSKDLDFMKRTIRKRKKRSRNCSGSLLVVDIQPSYLRHIPFDEYEFVEWINSSIKRVKSALILFVGEELGGDSLTVVREWYRELGLYYSPKIKFYNKDYGFFRNCMDLKYLNVPELVKVVKYMYNKKLTDSRELTEEDADFVPVDRISTDDPIFVPVDILKTLEKLDSPVTLVGSASDACLAEIEIALQAIDKPYVFNKDWIWD